MMKAIVNTAVCSMLAGAGRENTVVDEALYGMVVDILDEPALGWLKIRTHYRYEGIVSADDLIISEEGAANWEALPKKVVWNKNCCDVLSEPKVEGWHLQNLVRGCVVSPVGEADNGWQKVLLADGRAGYAQASILGEHFTAPCSENEEELRQSLVETAKLYCGTHYRWGGKSPMGIDCSGLTSMAYMLCGILIYRDAKMVEGFPIREIPREEMKLGDLIFFPGHVAMYIGDHEYIHSTGHSGDDGVTLNSLNPRAHNFREDLAAKIIGVGSYF